MMERNPVSSDVPSILMVCTVFNLEENSRGLLRELADALVRAGSKVQVCVLDWADTTRSEARLHTMENGIRVLTVPAWQIGRSGSIVAGASKWIGSSFFAIAPLRRHFGRDRVDLLLDFSPLVVTAGALLWAKRHFACQGYAYLTDFFPFHQRGAGQNIGGELAFRLGLAIETHLLRRFETIGCMSPAGVDYVRSHYRLKPNQQVCLQHLWGDSTLPPDLDRHLVRDRHNLPRNVPIILFGGQIAEGRGIEELLDVAERAMRVRPELTFLFMGSGRLESIVLDRIQARRGNIILKGPVDRAQYLSLVTACDVGIVSTVADTGVPSFPSKTIDYLRAGIPIVASVEATTDYSAFITRNGVGIAIEAGDPDRFLAAILTTIDSPDRPEMKLRARKALRTHFDVDKAARSILAAGLGFPAEAP